MKIQAFVASIFKELTNTLQEKQLRMEIFVLPNDKPGNEEITIELKNEWVPRSDGTKLKYGDGISIIIDGFIVNEETKPSMIKKIKEEAYKISALEPQIKIAS